MQQEENKSCPSSHAKPGAILLGKVNESGTIGYIQTPIEIDEAFIEAAGDMDLERSFRFSSKCVKNGCAQWQDGQCGVIKKVMQFNEGFHLQHPALPDCSIRPTCRWYSQEGEKACSYCPYVITNSMEETCGV
jgi:hypothetical protein